MSESSEASSGISSVYSALIDNAFSSIRELYNMENGDDATLKELERMKKEVRNKKAPIHVQAAIKKGEVSEAIQNRKREIENKYKTKG